MVDSLAVARVEVPVLLFLVQCRRPEQRVRDALAGRVDLPFQFVPSPVGLV
jgi:hypothetical protein